MSVFSVPVTIGVDEERIAKEIEKNVEDRVVAKITDEIKEVIYKKGYYGTESNEPLRSMINNQIRNVIQINEELIIQEAAKILADKMARSKACREATKEVVDKVNKEG